MRKPSKFGIALLAAAVVGLGMTGCGEQEESAAESAAPSEAAESASATAGAQEEKSDESETDEESTKVESIEAMVEKMKKKDYACQQWKQTDDVAGADASGTCNGKDQVMWFADASKAEKKAGELDAAGTRYVVGENWIVANTATPTLVRNALGGTAVSGK